MEKETFMNEKGIMVTVPSWPDSSDISLIMKSFSKKPFFFMCLPKSQKGDAKTGTTGIPPHSIKTEIYEPKEFHEEKYRNHWHGDNGDGHGRGHGDHGRGHGGDHDRGDGHRH